MFAPVADPVPTRPLLAWQPGLWCAEPPAADRTFRSLRRVRLDDTSWVDQAPGWLAGSDALFEELLAAASWTSREVAMYDRILPEPRLTARWHSGQLPQPLEDIRAALAAHYDTAFDSVGVNLYRDGSDSVAWHSDRVAARLVDPLVATVTLGGGRRFLLRPRAGGSSVRLVPGRGDLLVMGGSTQHDWQHCVPKTARPVGPRMAVTVRHST
jgi:alkylated DNA repair dioxygenase AlkB